MNAVNGIRSALKKKEEIKGEGTILKGPDSKISAEAEYSCTGFFEQRLGQRVLHYKELSALKFSMLSFRLCCRVGPLLQLT